MHGASITILCKNGLLSEEKSAMPKRGSSYEQNHYAAAIVKRTAGCTENQGSWPWANWQHVYFFSEMHGNIECTITKTLFFLFTTGQTRGALYTVLFIVMQKLGRSYTLSASKILINININGI